MVVSESSAQRYALDPDVRLMLEVRDDSAAAFEELVLRYQSRLLRMLERLVGNRELAEDLAQEVFLRVYRSRKQYVAGAKFATWLFTIANNAASNAPAQPVAAPRGQPPRRGQRLGDPPDGQIGPGGQRPDARPTARQGGDARGRAARRWSRSRSGSGWRCC